MAGMGRQNDLSPSGCMPKLTMGTVLTFSCHIGYAPGGDGAAVRGTGYTSAIRWRRRVTHASAIRLCPP